MKLSQIFQVFVPKDRKFFPLFVEAAENLVATAAEFKELVKCTGDDLADRIVAVRTLEKKGDNLTHKIYEELNNTFITPFDRDDVHRLANSIDNVLDQINSACQKISRYQPKMPVDAFIAFSDLIYDAALEIRKAMQEINNLRDPELIMQACVRLNELENNGDDVFDAFISKLFREEKDAVELIKQKEIISALEKATDASEDVADILKSIMVKTV